MIRSYNRVRIKGDGIKGEVGISNIFIKTQGRGVINSLNCLGHHLCYASAIGNFFSLKLSFFSAIRNAHLVLHSNDINPCASKWRAVYIKLAQII